NPENSKTIQDKGQVRILAELPQQETVTAETVAALSRLIPAWDDVWGAMQVGRKGFSEKV
ncbi:MAG: hypothetical protein ABF513_10375, partial [Acetobacter malorum]